MFANGPIKYLMDQSSTSMTSDGSRLLVNYLSHVGLIRSV